jgi:ElaB/YqjD/DUF883 family membrane-anchored ribosome-binding protein
MSTRTPAEKMTDSARQMADEVLESAQDAVQSTRKMAHSALDSAEESVRSMRKQADPLVDDLAARAQDLASRSIDFCAESSARARRQFLEASEATTKYVAEQPAKSMAIAVASGAALASLFLWMTRKNRND